jgi:hypothetical protein
MLRQAGVYVCEARWVDAPLVLNLFTWRYGLYIDEEKDGLVGALDKSRPKLRTGAILHSALSI